MMDTIGFAVSAAVAFAVGAAIQAAVDRRHRSRVVEDVIAGESAAHLQRARESGEARSVEAESPTPDRDVETSR